MKALIDTHGFTRGCEASIHHEAREYLRRETINHPDMGKGDRKSKKGKRRLGSSGKSRPSVRNARRAARKAAGAAKPAKKAAPKKAAAKKAAPKKAAAKKAAKKD